MRTTRRLAGYVAVVAAIALISNACSWRPPTLTVSLDAKQKESTQILADDGTVLATLHAAENRDPVTLDRVPEVMRRAIIDIEDPSYYDHKGVDYRALLRSVWHDLRYGAAIEGGSTITEQFL